MKNKVEILVTIAFVLLFVMPILARDFSSNSARPFDKPLEPHLVYPVNDVVSVTQDDLVFKWWHASIGIDRFEFNLYKDSDMVNDNLIFKQVLPFNISSLSLSANMFENNQVYTWSLRQVANNGVKSDKSFITFRVIKK